MHVRCPHCHNRIEFVDEAPLGETTCPSCHSSFSLLGDQTVTAKFAPHKSVAHFELVSPLGSGGFGTVWMARDTELDRTVALKVPRQEQLAKEEVEQFLREARAAAQLRHPNIVTVHEIGRDGDTVYIVSEFIRGVSLADWLTAHRLSFRESAELVATVADALHHAHEQGVIHRDLKPGNIMLETLDPNLSLKSQVASLKPYLTDFGIAKREAGEITMTVEGKILGTPAYMSPEQARGEGHFADRRSDIYSLGVMLFQLLTSELPFRGNIRMLLHQVVHDEPPSPRKLDSAVPRDLETICLKCLEREPDRRYQSAAELAADLNRWLAGEPIKARPPTLTYLAAKWLRQNARVALGSVGIGMFSGLVLSAAVICVIKALIDASTVYEQFHTQKRPALAVLAGITPKEPFLVMWVLLVFGVFAMLIPPIVLLRPDSTTTARMAVGAVVGYVCQTVLLICGFIPLALVGDLKNNEDMKLLASAMTEARGEGDKSNNSTAPAAPREASLSERYPQLSTVSAPGQLLSQKIAVDVASSILVALSVMFVVFLPGFPICCALAARDFGRRLRNYRQYGLAVMLLEQACVLSLVAFSVAVLIRFLIFGSQGDEFVSLLLTILVDTFVAVFPVTLYLTMWICAGGELRWCLLRWVMYAFCFSWWWVVYSRGSATAYAALVGLAVASVLMAMYVARTQPNRRIAVHPEHDTPTGWLTWTKAKWWAPFSIK